MISFIIPTYKNDHSLSNCILCIQEATEKIGFEDYEIILIDNNIEQNSRVSNVFTNIRKLILLHNSIPGAHASRKLGISVAKGKIFVFIDDDNYLEAKYLSYIISIRNSDFEDFMIGCANDSYLPIDWNKLNLPPHSFACGSLDGVIFKQGIPVFWGAGIAMNRMLALKIYANPLIVDGRQFGKRIIFSGEDHEISLRAYFYGAKHYYFSEIGLFHHLNSERLNQNYHDRLIMGFELAAWNLRIYYWHNEKSVFSSSTFQYFLGNLIYSFGYIVLNPFKISALKILKEALSYNKAKVRFNTIKDVLKAS